MPFIKSAKRWWKGVRQIGLDYGATGAVHAKSGGDLFDVAVLSMKNRPWASNAIRGRCASSYLHGTEAVCRFLGKYLMFVDTTDIGFSTHMMMEGFWEIDVTEALVARLKPGMTFVDCGANLGYYSVLAADLVGAEGRVMAIEPNPHMASRLRKTITVNGFADRVELHELALGDGGGAIVLRVPPGEPKNAHLVDMTPEQAAITPDHHLVTLGRLDDLIGDRPVDIIKIDVEGAEEALWRGLSGLLARGTPLTIFLEFNADRYDNPAGFLDALLDHGFHTEAITIARGVFPINREEILGAPTTKDHMLLLTREHRPDRRSA